MTIENIKQQIEEIFPWLVNIRRDFHQYPELGFQEHRTAAKICDYLKELKIDHYRVVDTGVVAGISGEQPNGRVIALRADIDALPMQDQKTVAYRSRHDGIAHTCGHDAHAAIQLAAARILAANRQHFAGTVKLFFQPAEESVGGALPMIEAGVMDNPKVGAVLGLHVHSSLPVGKVAVHYGKMNAATDSIEVKIFGQTAHGAYPHRGVDAIVIAAQVINALQTVVSRDVDPTEGVVVTIGSIHGGDKNNIIAGEVTLSGTIRTLTTSNREHVRQRVRQIITECANLLGGRAEVDLIAGYEPLINNDRMTDLVREAATEAVGDSQIVVFREQPSLGAEDFSFFANRAPGCFYSVGVGNAEKGITAAAHNGLFDIDEQGLKVGVLTQISAVLKLLKK